MGDVVKSELDVCDKGYCDGGEDYGHKGDAAEAGDESFVDLAFVDFVKEIAAEGNQEYLRYKKTCKEYAQNEYAQQVNWPISHNSGA